MRAWYFESQPMDIWALVFDLEFTQPLFLGSRSDSSLQC
jgi:hypothetical protein